MIAFSIFDTFAPGHSMQQGEKFEQIPVNSLLGKAAFIPCIAAVSSTDELKFFSLYCE